MISVIIPVYDQYEALDVILWHFCRQTIQEPFEIVIVDDGSTFYNEKLFEKYKSLKIKYVRYTANKGRSYVRNVGIDNCSGEYLIFCDCDRIPSPMFIESHMKLINSSDPILSIGYSTETYNDIDKLKLDAETIIRRKSIYYRVISQIYDEFGNTDSHLCWLSTMSGNMALKKSTLGSNYFDCDFKKWGFEHFELGFRLWKDGVIFKNNLKAENIHIAHPRPKGFYADNIASSYKLFLDKHPNKEIYPLKRFMMGEISLQEYESIITGGMQWIKNKSKPILVNRVNI